MTKPLTDEERLAAIAKEFRPTHEEPRPEPAPTPEAKIPDAFELKVAVGTKLKRDELAQVAAVLEDTSAVFGPTTGRLVSRHGRLELDLEIHERNHFSPEVVDDYLHAKATATARLGGPRELVLTESGNRHESFAERNVATAAERALVASVLEEVQAVFGPTTGRLTARHGRLELDLVLHERTRFSSEVVSAYLDATVTTAARIGTGGRELVLTESGNRHHAPAQREASSLSQDENLFDLTQLRLR